MDQAPTADPYIFNHVPRWSNQQVQLQVTKLSVNDRFALSLVCACGQRKVYLLPVDPSNNEFVMSDDDMRDACSYCTEHRHELKKEQVVPDILGDSFERKIRDRVIVEADLSGEELRQWKETKKFLSTHPDYQRLEPDNEKLVSFLEKYHMDYTADHLAYAYRVLFQGWPYTYANRCLALWEANLQRDVRAAAKIPVEPPSDVCYTDGVLEPMTGRMIKDEL